MHKGASLILSLTFAAALASSGVAPAVADELAMAGNGLRSISPVMFDDRLVSGYPLERGRFNKAEAMLGHLERVKSHLDLALHIDLAVLRRWPEVFDDDRVAYEYARRFLIGDTLSRFVAGCRYGSCSVKMPYDGWAGTNEFEREGSAREFVKTYQPLFIGAAAEFPRRLVQVLKVNVQPYDDSRHGFPLQRHPHASVFSSVVSAVPLTIEMAWSMPAFVIVERADAAAFLEKLETPDRSAFLGLRVSLAEPDWDRQLDRPELRLLLEGAALYADPDLLTEIHEFGLWGTN